MMRRHLLTFKAFPDAASSKAFLHNRCKYLKLSVTIFIYLSKLFNTDWKILLGENASGQLSYTNILYLCLFILISTGAENDQIVSFESESWLSMCDSLGLVHSVKDIPVPGGVHDNRRSINHVCLHTNEASWLIGQIQHFHYCPKVKC